MGRRSREEYLRHLQRALDDLQAINFRFQQRGDLVTTRDDLNRWKKTTMVTIEEHGAIEDGRRFQIHVDFDVLGLTDGYVLEGIEKYESFLRDLIKTSSTSSLGDLGGVSGEGTEDLEDSERSPMAAEERNRNLNRVGNRKKVFVVHGRNEAARVAMF